MHLPDGSLTPAVWIPAAAASAAAIVFARRRTAGEASRQMGRAAALTAIVFASQALHYPIPGGSSGHLLGAALLTACLGPSAAILAMAAVFGVQAALLGDGGLTALGANILNGGVLPALATQLLLTASARASSQSSPLGRAIAAGAGAFAGVLLGAAAASAEVAASGTAPFAPFLAAMLGAHAWIGLAEGILTAAAVKLWTAAETPLTHVPPARPAFAAAGAVLTIAAAAELLGAARPDGLESALGAFGRGFGNASLTSGAPAIAAIALALLGAAACAALTFAAARPSRARGAA